MTHAVAEALLERVIPFQFLSRARRAELATRLEQRHCEDMLGQAEGGGA